MKGPAARGTRRRASRWLAWLLGGAILAAVVVASLHLSEGRAFVRLVDAARPWWLVVAALLQAATYLFQGQVWRAVARAADARVTLPTAYRLSLAKLFVDQAVPSAGISGTVLIARALEAHGLRRSVVMAAVVVNTASYWVAYVSSLAIAMAITIARGHASGLIIASSALLAVFGVALTLAVLAISDWRGGAVTRVFGRVPLVRNAIVMLREAEPRLARSRPLLARSTALQLAIVMLDAGTVWVLLRALGTTASPTGVFASFMISSLLRTLSVIPAGLGTFEAVSVVTLQLAGVALPAALSATLLFRGLSFWLPLVPGLVFSRGAIGTQAAAAPRPRSTTPGRPATGDS